MQSGKNLVVITDLDGTLLDHYTYRFTAARPALDLLAKLDIPLILNSSKTAAELLSIRETLNNHHPFIIENGGGIYLPKGDDYEVIALGTPREDFLPVVSRLKNDLQLKFRGFSDMTDEELSEYTGLSQQESHNARKRDFTEPLLWQDNETSLRTFSVELAKHGLQASQGGRFIHISGITDKGKSVAWLRDYYKRLLNNSIYVIALGDSPNDIEMLNNADFAIVIRSPVHEPLLIEKDNLLVSEHFGPEGWNESVNLCLEKLNII